MNKLNDFNARLALFSGVEGGQIYWTEQVRQFGAIDVYSRVKSGYYDSRKYGKTLEKIKTTSIRESRLRLINSGASFITPESESWPSGLNDLTAAPFGLVVKGDIGILKATGIAIVGTRNPTPYGIKTAWEFATGFVDRQWSVISGGAYGIDFVYPAGNARLFAEICENGALVSEVLPGMHPIPSRFLTRNRIIAALSQATLVVEAAFRSGSLRTARDAAELMRPVMAIPGPISAPTSEGCHRLIGERAAELVTSVADAFELVSTL